MAIEIIDRQAKTAQKWGGVFFKHYLSNFFYG